MTWPEVSQELGVRPRPFPLAAGFFFFFFLNNFVSPSTFYLEKCQTTVKLKK